MWNYLSLVSHWILCSQHIGLMKYLNAGCKKVLLQPCHGHLQHVRIGEATRGEYAQTCKYNLSIYSCKHKAYTIVSVKLTSIFVSP